MQLGIKSYQFIKLYISIELYIILQMSYSNIFSIYQIILNMHVSSPSKFQFFIINFYNTQFLKMECPMCFDLYDHQEKIPRNLNCGHTACQQCLNYSFDKKKMLECPTCRYKHDSQIRPSTLSKNYIALQLASQKRQLRQNHQFCPTHDQPYKFYCQEDKEFVCVQCIVDHTGHHFTKQDQNFFTTKKSLSQELQRLQIQQKTLLSYQKQFSYVKQQMITKYQSSINEIDKIFSMLKSKLIDQQYKSKQSVRKFLQRELEHLTQNQSEVASDLEKNLREKARISSILEKMQKQRKVSQSLDNTFDTIPDKASQYKKPTVVEFPVCVSPFRGDQNFVMLYYKTSPKICFFGQRKKLFTVCPLTGVHNLTTITNAQIQYYGSACTLPTGQIIITGGGSSSHCYLFSLKDPNSLQRKKSMINARKEHSCVYLKGNVYVISGYDGKNKCMAGCQAYDIFTEQWVTIKGLNVPRCAFAATVCDGKIYIFGGYDGKQRLNSIEVYNPELNKWTLLSATLKFPLSNAAAVSQGKYIYILGGGWLQGFNQQVFRFDVQSHEFKSYEKMQKGRDLRNKAIKFKNQIFAIGGNFYDGEKLDLHQGKWTQLKSYHDLMNDNLDSWSCALAYNSQQYQIQKYQHLQKVFKKKSILNESFSQSLNSSSILDRSTLLQNL